MSLTTNQKIAIGGGVGLMLMTSCAVGICLYVRYQKSKDSSSTITEASAPVTAPIVPVHLTPAGASMFPSTYADWKATNCIDNDPKTQCHSDGTGRAELEKKLTEYKITDRDMADQALVINLPADKSYTVTRIEIVNRVDCCRERIENGTVTVYNSSGERKFQGSILGIKPSYSIEVAPHVTDARVIIISHKKGSTMPIHLADVNVFGAVV
jgi:hypothetical protein